MTDRLVRGYLERLADAGRDLPRERRDELCEEIAAHIAEARAAGATSEAELRTVLDRLGDPAEIADEARGSRVPVRVSTGWETTAVLMLTVGSLLLPGIGWLVGVVMLRTSALWTTREKWLGTLVVPGGLALPALLSVFPVSSCYSSGTVDAQGHEVVLSDTCSGQTSVPTALVVTALVLLVLAPVVVAYVLRGRARARAAGELVQPLGSGLTAFGRTLVVLGFVLMIGPLVATAVLNGLQGEEGESDVPGVVVPAVPSPMPSPR